LWWRRHLFTSAIFSATACGIGRKSAKKVGAWRRHLFTTSAIFSTAMPRVVSGIRLLTSWLLYADPDARFLIHFRLAPF
jgi:ABC-type dipeptide/oligopeptide/nickel transport system permease component